MSTLFKPSSQTEMKARFPDLCHAATEIITRELIRILLFIMKCAQTRNTNFDQLNMFYVTVPAAIYTLMAGTGRVHPGVPMKPPITPNYGEEETSAGQDTIRDLWFLNNKFHAEDENTNHILCTIFLSLLPREEVKGFIANNLADDPNMRFAAVFEHFWATHGMVREKNVLENTKLMQADRQPHQGIQILFGQIEEGVTFVIFARKSIDEQTMVESFLIIIKKTGQYQTYYEEWM